MDFLSGFFGLALFSVTAVALLLLATIVAGFVFAGVVYVVGWIFDKISPLSISDRQSFVRSAFITPAVFVGLFLATFFFIESAGDTSDVVTNEFFIAGLVLVSAFVSWIFDRIDSSIVSRSFFKELEVD